MAADSIVKLSLESNQYDKGIRQAKKQWQDFTKSLGLNLGKITAVGVALGAATAALKATKDAFLASEATVDEWGRTMQSAKSLYQGFLNALNTGDISGYLTNINNIVAAARKAYDELDRLGTMRTIQAPQIGAQQTENERLRSMIRTGRYISPLEGGGEPGMVNGQQLTKEQIRIYEQQLQDGVGKVVSLMTNEVRQSTSAIDAFYQSMATDLGMSLEDFRKGTSSMAEFDKMIAGAQKYSQYINDNTITSVNSMYGTRQSFYAGGANPYQQYKGWDVFRVDGERFKELTNLIQQRDQQTSNVYGMVAQAYQTINRAEGTTVRSIMNGGSSGAATAAKEEYIPMAGSIDAQVAKVKELQDAFNAAGSDGIRMGLLPQLKEAEQTLERMRNLGDFAATTPTGIPGTELSPIAMPTFDDSAREKAAALAKIAEQNREAWQAAAGAIGQVGQALQMIEDPAIKVAGIIAEAIANIALSFSQAMLATGKTAPWAWLAFAATGSATMISTIAAIKQSTAGSYATGGIVPGNHFSGDQQLIRANAGEVVLNQAQQGVLASRLQQGSLPNNLQLSAVITGEQIHLLLNNYGRRTLAGEYLTTKMQRP